MSNTSFVGQYGPLIASLIALGGVILTLSVNARREQAQYRSQREDEFRSEQRIAVAAIVEAAQIFRMTCGWLAEDEAIQRSRTDDTVSMDRAQTAVQTLLNKLSVARLLIHDGTLQDALDNMYKAWLISTECVNAIADTSAREVYLSHARELNLSWPQFDKAAAGLQEAALDRLKPTVLSDRKPRGH